MLARTPKQTLNHAHIHAHADAQTKLHKDTLAGGLLEPTFKAVKDDPKGLRTH